jgi:hypothetical protein
MNYLHHILYNACDSQAWIYYKNRWIFFPGLTNGEQSAKFYFFKFEVKLYEIRFLF